ncbi:MAG: hypothetical protein GC180_05730 [Bacteroidetes bacterium]|nr:hypothetical protein [Bacteroidota bacterium]
MRLLAILAFFFALPAGLMAQNKDLRINLNENGTHYVKFTGMSQVWLRYNQSNPGTTVYGDAAPNTFDVSIRRLRFQAFGQINDRVFVYTQIGQNNLNYLSARKVGLFIHDAITEYSVIKRNLSIGGGLTGWSGLGRYASPSIGTIMCMDAPLFLQATNDVSDQFLRKFSVYGKGKLGKLDYRIALTNPMPVNTSYTSINGGLVGGVDTTLSQYASFRPGKPNLQQQAYFMYQFKEEESNLTPYTQGTYLGNKTVFNIGAGVIYQKGATRSGDSSGVSNHDMLLIGIDVFYDAPLNKDKKTAITLYGGFFSYNFGPGYLHYIGVNNPATGVAAGMFQKGNQGNAFPMIGTGNIIYAQAGYKCKDDLLGKQGTLQPYADITLANYDRLNSSMMVYNAGLNWLIAGHGSKLSLNYQNRPVFNPDGNGKITNQGRKSMAVLQYQISF